MALSAGPRFRPVSETRKRGGGEGGRRGAGEKRSGCLFQVTVGS